VAGWRGWRGLPFGQAVGFVVHGYHSNIDIAQSGMDEVPGADAKQISVTADRDHGQVGTRHFQPLRHGQSPPMQAVETECLHKVRQTARTADTRHHYRLVGGEFHARHAVVDGI